MAASLPQYIEQLQLLQERYPHEPEPKLLHLLRKYDGDVYQVRACLFQRESRDKKLDSLETRFGAALTALLQENPSSQLPKRSHLLRIMVRFGGDVEYVRKYFKKIQDKQNPEQIDSIAFRRKHQEEIKTKYATQLAELASSGINVNCPSVLSRLEKSHGDVEKVVEITKRHKEKNNEITELGTKYADQIAQLEADGIKIKNKRYLTHLLDKANGQVDVVKQLLAEKENQKHHEKSPAIATNGDDEKISFSKKQHEIDADDLDNLRQLRSAGVHGNPAKILTVFHECNGSIEKTIARLEKEREQREQQSKKREQQRIVLAEIHDAYLTINNQDDWPQDIQQVYLDGNNMMFVVDSLRRLCLNRAGKKTERAIAEIAATWNEHMHIPNVDLIYDSTHQLDQIGSVRVSSAHPRFKTTDDMLIEIARRDENRERNRHTVVVTSDRALAIQLKHEGCLLVKSFSWFAHCVMVLTPDLVNHNETNKTRYNLDGLVHRIAKIDI